MHTLNAYALELDGAALQAIAQSRCAQHCLQRLCVGPGIWEVSGAALQSCVKRCVHLKELHVIRDRKMVEDEASNHTLHSYNELKSKPQQKEAEAEERKERAPKALRRIEAASATEQMLWRALNTSTSASASASASLLSIPSLSIHCEDDEAHSSEFNPTYPLPAPFVALPPLPPTTTLCSASASASASACAVSGSAEWQNVCITGTGLSGAFWAQLSLPQLTTLNIASIVLQL